MEGAHPEQQGEVQASLVKGVLTQQVPGAACVVHSSHLPSSLPQSPRWKNQDLTEKAKTDAALEMISPK